MNEVFEAMHSLTRISIINHEPREEDEEETQDFGCTRRDNACWFYKRQGLAFQEHFTKMSNSSSLSRIHCTMEEWRTESLPKEFRCVLVLLCQDIQGMRSELFFKFDKCGCNSCPGLTYIEWIKAQTGIKQPVP